MMVLLDLGYLGGCRYGWYLISPNPFALITDAESAQNTFPDEGIPGSAAEVAFICATQRFDE